MFQPVGTIKNLRGKRFFIEKINIYIKLINSFAEKNRIEQQNEKLKLDLETFARLEELEIISNEHDNDILILKNILKIQLFNKLISAVNFNILYKAELSDILSNLDPAERRKKQSELNHEMPCVIDFFCGAGGLSLGFRQAGFNIDLANDCEDVCIETFRFNHPEVPDERIILGDIRNIVDNINHVVNKDIDVVVGGPPCQGFSSANQQRIIDDPRNELYKYFIQAVAKIAPKFVIMENVKGMLPYADQIVEDYENVEATKGEECYSYKVSYQIMVSSEFGVAQKRQRLIFIAIRSDLVERKGLIPDSIFKQIKDSAKNGKQHVLKDALSYIQSLESPRVKNLTEVDDEITGKKIAVNQYKGNENSYLKLINQGRLIPFTFNHKARYTSDVNYEIYRTLDQGEDGTSEKIQHIMPYKHRNHIFKDKYFKLVETKPSRTITAHLKMDCHSHIHPTQVRSITPREAARIQSFPDDYVFLGAYLKTYMQIGNAVPPIMAKAIATEIKKHL